MADLSKAGRRALVRLQRALDDANATGALTYLGMFVDTGGTISDFTEGLDAALASNVAPPEEPPRE